MLARININVIQMPLEISAVTNNVVPETRLPNLFGLNARSPQGVGEISLGAGNDPRYGNISFRSQQPAEVVIENPVTPVAEPVTALDSTHCVQQRGFGTP